MLIDIQFIYSEVITSMSDWRKINAEKIMIKLDLEFFRC